MTFSTYKGEFVSKNFEKTVVFSALEVANICSVANQTAINWIRNGYLKAYSTPGGQYRVYADDLVNFMTDRKMRIPKDLETLCERKTPVGILIVEDEVGLNSVIKQYFKKEFPDAELYQAFDGFEAGSIMVGKKPDVVILDLNLPGVDGLELCKKINATDEFGNPAVIVITALQDTEIEKQVHDLNVIAFFRKPLVLSELSQAIRSCSEK